MLFYSHNVYTLGKGYMIVCHYCVLQNVADSAFSNCLFLFLITIFQSPCWMQWSTGHWNCRCQRYLINSGRSKVWGHKTRKAPRYHRGRLPKALMEHKSIDCPQCSCCLLIADHRYYILCPQVQPLFPLIKLWGYTPFFFFPPLNCEHTFNFQINLSIPCHICIGLYYPGAQLNEKFCSMCFAQLHRRFIYHSSQ